MNIFDHLLRRLKRPDRDFLLAQVVAKHIAWFPVHNQGQGAPEDAKLAWLFRLRFLSKRDLIVLITDNHARNRVLGKKWPPLTEV